MCDRLPCKRSSPICVTLLRRLTSSVRMCQPTCKLWCCDASRKIQRTDFPTIEAFVQEAISNKASLICTDEFPAYGKLKKTHFHRSANHKRHKYVVGAVHTQTIEGFWSIMKRGMVGTFH